MTAAIIELEVYLETLKDNHKVAVSEGNTERDIDLFQKASEVQEAIQILKNQSEVTAGITEAPELTPEKDVIAHANHILKLKDYLSLIQNEEEDTVLVSRCAQDPIIYCFWIDKELLVDHLENEISKETDRLAERYES